MSLRRSTALGIVCATLLIVASTTADAQQMQCDIHSIRAATVTSVIAPALNPFRNFLGRPPLSSFSSFELIGTQSVRLPPGSTSPLNLGNNVSGQLRFQESNGPQRVLNLVLRHGNRTLLNTRFGVSPGHPFFVVVGSVIPEGTLVLGIVCT